MLRVGLVFNRLQQLRFIVRGQSHLGPMMPGIRDYTSNDRVKG